MDSAAITSRLFLKPRWRKPSAMAFNPAASGWFQSELSVSAPLTILPSNTIAGSRPRSCFLTSAEALMLRHCRDGHESDTLRSLAHPGLAQRSHRPIRRNLDALQRAVA